MNIELPSSLSTFPTHKKIAERIVALLQQDKRVHGIYLSGSFACGRPDAYSDLDFYILVPEETREQIKADHKTLREKAGDVVSDVVATHLGDPNQFITFYREDYPVHVDYQYRVSAELVPQRKDRDVLVLLDRSGELLEWKNKCADAVEIHSPTQESLQYFEDRFWGWCIYTDSKIKRGELWEPRDAVEYIRNNVLIRLLYYANSLRPEGNRRIDCKFPMKNLGLLESTVQRGHSREEYAAALLALANCYVQFMDDVTKQFGVRIREKDREYFRTFLKVSRLEGTT